LAPVLKDVLRYTPAQGWPPDMTDDARWWAMKALDGMPIADIAKMETGDDPDAADFEETISKALRRLGVTLRTE